MNTPKTLAPQQARSRESTRKLLQAAADILKDFGVDGATIPRIAQQAGLTPGAIYRRFADKEALLEAVILDILEQQDEQLRAALTPTTVKQIPLTVLVEQIVHAMLVSYRANAGLLRAVRQFAQGREQTAFHKQVSELEMGSFQYLVELFLVHQEEISHSDPKTAVSFALVSLTSMLIELILVDKDMTNWRLVMPMDDKTLKGELRRAFLNYLGVSDKGV
ncbi:TetR/AcrR family transcriptional regulator [Undibacterium sp.]|uniref:TetR/AcrR family transcriptional regulator n=1 Tax=Undibacterium sp. TaxID=1914977 RepID=UPI00374D9C9C